MGTSGSTSGAWTDERRAKQAELIRRVKPWEKSTGPTTAESKAVSSMNAWRGSSRALDRASARVMRIQEAIIGLETHMLGRPPLAPNTKSWRKRARKADAIQRDEDRMADMLMLLEHENENFMRAALQHIGS